MYGRTIGIQTVLVMGQLYSSWKAYVTWAE